MKLLFLIGIFLPRALCACDKSGLEHKINLLKMLEKPSVTMLDIESSLLWLLELARTDYVMTERGPLYRYKVADDFAPHRRIFRAEDVFLHCLLAKPSIELSEKHVDGCLKVSQEPNGESFVTKDTLFLVSKIVDARRKISGAIG